MTWYQIFLCVGTPVSILASGILVALALLRRPVSHQLGGMQRALQKGAVQAGDEPAWAKPEAPQHFVPPDTSLQHNITADSAVVDDVKGADVLKGLQKRK